MTVQFTTYGLAVPQGSKSAFVAGKRAVLREGSSAAGAARHKDWRAAVADSARAAQAEAQCGLLEGPLTVEVCFYLPRPKSAPKRVIRPCGSRIDVDKLARSICDSLTNVLIVDDGHVVSLHVEKWFATETISPCAIVRVSPTALGAMPCLLPAQVVPQDEARMVSA